MQQVARTASVASVPSMSRGLYCRVEGKMLAMVFFCCFSHQSLSHKKRMKNNNGHISEIANIYVTPCRVTAAVVNLPGLLSEHEHWDARRDAAEEAQ